jgi:hypothetical protein
VGLAVVAGIALQHPAVAGAAVAPADKCESTKVKAAGKYAKCTASAYSKAIKKSEAADTAKLGKCTEKLGGLFGKAEEKGTDSCPTSGDAIAIQDTLDACIDDAVAALGGVPGPGGDGAKCQSKKVKAAGKYADCLFKTLSKGIKKGESPVYSDCSGKLADQWTKAETKTCSTTGDLGAVQEGLDHCFELVAGSLNDPLFECVDASDCDDETVCTTDSCNLTNQCVNEAISCDDNNECTVDTCDAVTECANDPVADDTPCGTAGTCQVGACIGVEDYLQDFEALVQVDTAALGNDGWLVFANVFGLDWAYWYGYGPFPAPNDPSSPAFCLIAAGEGGAEQGSQQLVVFSDYNNDQHPIAWIESNVFQEHIVEAGDVGRTLTFQFDAKLGDITPPSTALAFIKTLDGGSLIDFVTVDTTSIAPTWDTYSISLNITGPLVGKTLQYGFANTATNYAASGVFYDNVVAWTAPTP